MVMLLQLHKISLFILLAGIVSVCGCASFKPHPITEAGFQVRTQTQSKGGVRVAAAVLSAEESEAVTEDTADEAGPTRPDDL